MDSFKKGWFTEASPMWPGQTFSLEVSNVLVDKKTKYQHLIIFESKTYGRVLVLDGVIQVTERDEASYHEMMAFMALNCHPNPRKVLVIGGGDGGVAREVAKHPAVESIVQCEIDEEVVNACKEHLPSLACGYADPRHKLHIGDGMEFLLNCKEKFDIIITDALDPEVFDEAGNKKDGPAQSLFKENYYKALHDTLADDGILLSQGGCWLHAELIGKLIKKSRTLYPVVDFSSINTPTYPCGQIGLILCSKNKSTNFRKPLTVFSSDQLKSMGLKYYNDEVHLGSLLMPTFMKSLLKD